jgi:allantoin racemase
VQRAYEAEKKGYDGFIIGCASDLGLKEARSLVNIPVVGSTEATALTACTLGYKFSAICLDQTACPRIEALIRSYGLGDRLASVRSPERFKGHFSVATMAQNWDAQQEVVDVLVSEMRKAVIQDNAEVLWISCGPGAAMVSAHGVNEVEGAPVLNLFTTALKMAEGLVSIQRAFGTKVSRRSIYLGPPTDWEKEIPIEID